MAITRVCYATREEVARALDVKAAAYVNSQIDRQIMSGSDSVDDLTNRVFFPEDDTRFFDWPAIDASYTWRLYLNQNELAVSPAVLVKSGTVVIPPTNYILRPETGPPFRRLELRRDLSSTFGNGSTPQQDITIQGTFGFWNQLALSGALAASVTTASITTLTVTNGASPGVGDMMVVGTERMIVQDRLAAPTGISFTSGCTTVSAADNQMAVPDGTQFTIGEVLLIDAERMLIQDISGNVLIMKRAWSGTVLAAHSPGPITAYRKLVVIRGALGTTAATHNNGDGVSVLVIPHLVKELGVGEALAGMINEPAGYSAPGQIRESMAGTGLYNLRCSVESQYGRNMRKRAI
jgi:hypothetical protein